MGFEIPAAPIERLRTIRPAMLERLENVAFLSLDAQPGFAARWGWRTAMAGRMISSGQIRRLRERSIGYARRRLTAGKKRG